MRSGSVSEQMMHTFGSGRTQSPGDNPAMNESCLWCGLQHAFLSEDDQGRVVEAHNNVCSRMCVPKIDVVLGACSLNTVNLVHTLNKCIMPSIPGERRVWVAILQTKIWSLVRSPAYIHVSRRRSIRNPKRNNVRSPLAVRNPPRPPGLRAFRCPHLIIAN